MEKNPQVEENSRNFASTYGFPPPLVLRAQTPKTSKGGVDKIAGSFSHPSLVSLMHHVWPLGRPQSDLKTPEFPKNSILNTSYNTSFIKIVFQQPGKEKKRFMDHHKMDNSESCKACWLEGKHYSSEVRVLHSRRKQRYQTSLWCMFRNYIPLEECQETKVETTSKEKSKCETGEPFLS